MTNGSCVLLLRWLLIVLWGSYKISSPTWYLSWTAEKVVLLPCISRRRSSLRSSSSLSANILFLSWASLRMSAVDISCCWSFSAWSKNVFHERNVRSRALIMCKIFTPWIILLTLSKQYCSVPNKKPLGLFARCSEKLRNWSFKQLLLFLWNVQSLKLTGDQMLSYGSHFVGAIGDLLWPSCKPAPPIFSTCSSPPNPVYTTKRIETTFTVYEQKKNRRTDCFGRNIYRYP